MEFPDLNFLPNTSIRLYDKHKIILIRDIVMVQEAPTKDKLTCLIPKTLNKRAKQAALDYETSVTQLVIEGLTELLDKKYPKK